MLLIEFTKQSLLLALTTMTIGQPKNRNNAEELIPRSATLNDIAQNKSFAMFYDAMMENYESTAVADR